jgi:hypothetical protein
LSSWSFAQTARSTAGRPSLVSGSRAVGQALVSAHIKAEIRRDQLGTARKAAAEADVLVGIEGDTFTVQGPATPSRQPQRIITALSQGEDHMMPRLELVQGNWQLYRPRSC